MTDETLMRSMLYDFYGELLTDKQREYFDLHYNNDLSLSEIAEQTGISRQGVWDNIRRAQDAMGDMEKKTGLVKRFLEINEAVTDIQTELEGLRNTPPEELGSAIDGIKARLEGLKG